MFSSTSNLLKPFTNGSRLDRIKIACAYINHMHSRVDFKTVCINAADWLALELKLPFTSPQPIHRHQPRTIQFNRCYTRVKHTSADTNIHTHKSHLMSVIWVLGGTHIDTQCVAHNSPVTMLLIFNYTSAHNPTGGNREPKTYTDTKRLMKYLYTLHIMARTERIQTSHVCGFVRGTECEHDSVVRNTWFKKMRADHHNHRLMNVT